MTGVQTCALPISSLSGVKDNLLVVEGLDMKQALSTDGGNHPRAQGAWLTGSRARRTDGPDMFLGVSMDQVVAKEFASQTQLGSIELAMEPTDLAGNCGFGFSCAYNNTLAWRNATTPLPTENTPRAVFERLFGASDGVDRESRQRAVRDRKSTRLNSSHIPLSRMPSSA